jgi:hypothetical protein
VELRTGQEVMDPVNRTIVPSSPSDGEPLSEKEELSALKAGLRKVKIFKDYVGVGRAKKACREEDGSDGRFSARSDGCEYVFDSDSVDECDEDEAEDKDGFSFRNSFSYGTLAAANRVEGALYLDLGEDGDDDNWKKRKLNFRSPRARGEPLLNKAYGEEGGDDIDFDRRQLCCPIDSLPLVLPPSRLSLSFAGIFYCIFGGSILYESGCKQYDIGYRFCCKFTISKFMTLFAFLTLRFSSILTIGYMMLVFYFASQNLKF